MFINLSFCWVVCGAMWCRTHRKKTKCDRDRETFFKVLHIVDGTHTLVQFSSLSTSRFQMNSIKSEFPGKFLWPTIEHQHQSNSLIRISVSEPVSQFIRIDLNQLTMDIGHFTFVNYSIERDCNPFCASPVACGWNRNTFSISHFSSWNRFRISEKTYFLCKNIEFLRTIDTIPQCNHCNGFSIVATQQILDKFQETNFSIFACERSQSRTANDNDSICFDSLSNDNRLQLQLTITLCASLSA